MDEVFSKDIKDWTLLEMHEYCKSRQFEKRCFEDCPFSENCGGHSVGIYDPSEWFSEDK